MAQRRGTFPQLNESKGKKAVPFGKAQKAGPSGANKGSSKGGGADRTKVGRWGDPVRSPNRTKAN